MTINVETPISKQRREEIKERNIIHKLKRVLQMESSSSINT